MHYEIKTDRLLLRPLDVSDLDTHHAYASDIDNTHYMVFLPNESMRETAQFLVSVTAQWASDDPDCYEFAIMLEGVHIGAISISLDDARNEGELGWIVKKQYWHKGYATEAARAVIDFAINTLHLTRIFAQCDARNSNSYGLMRKLGLTLEDDTGTRTYEKNGEVARELTCSMVVG